MVDEEVGRGRSQPAAVALVAAVTVVLSVAFTVTGLPSAVLFAALLGGMAHALTSTTPLAVPPTAFKVGQGLIGVTIGATVSAEALRQIAGDAVVIAVVTVATIGLSLLAGRVLALRDDVSVVTGTFSMIAGGASGVVALARELGADERVVTVVQYVRVLIVLLTLPLVTALVFRPPSGRGEVGPAGSSLPTDLVFVAATLVAGLVLARLVPQVPTATLLAPMAVAAVVASAGWLGEVQVPDQVEWVAFALIGVQVGLRFTRASLRAITRMLPLVLALIVGLLVLTALMGAALAWLTEVDGLTAYLATTPGGLFAVLATAADSGSDVTYVLALQVFRVVVILLLTPVLARVLRRHEA